MKIEQFIPIAHPVIFFDGVCHACNSFVNIILKLDRRRLFRFASIQSPVGKSVFEMLNSQPFTIDTIVLIENSELYTRSSAVFRILVLLGWPWKLFSVFSVLPRPFTDYLYRIFSRNRYRLFGKRETCRILTEAEQALFIQN